MADQALLPFGSVPPEEQEAIEFLTKRGYKIKPPPRKSPPPDRDNMTSRQRMYDFVNGQIDSWFELSILVLIFVNVIVFMLGTVYIGRNESIWQCDPKVDDCVRIDSKYDTAFYVFEIFTSFVFTIEFILRLWSCVEDPEFADPLWGRLRFCVTFHSVADIISFMPTWIELLPGVGTLGSTGWVRIFRLSRLLKAEEYVNAFGLLTGVISENSTLLLAASWYAGLMLIIFSTILYYTERDWSGETAEYYASIPQALFPTVLMLTGEFPLVNFSPLGQLFAAILAVTAVAIFAIPTGVLGSGFVQALQKSQGKEFTVDA